MAATDTRSVRRPPARAVPAGDHGPRALRWLGTAALATATAGALHLVAAARHVPAGELAVGFFLVVAAAQLGSAAWLAASAWSGSMPPVRHLLLVVTGTVGVLALFLVAETTAVLDAFVVPGDPGSSHAHGGTGGGTAGRTVAVDPVTGLDFSAGMPVDSGGPVAMAGDPAATSHGTGTLGAATAAAELLAVGALAALLPKAWRSRTADALFALGALAWLLWFTGVLR